MSVDTAGGAWGAVMAIARGLAGRGLDVTLAMLGPEPDARQRAEVNATPGLRAISTHAVAAREASGYRDLQAAGEAVARLANVLAADVAALHHPSLAAFGPFYAPVVVFPDSKDIIVASRSNKAPGHEWRARLLRSGYQNAAGIVTPTHADAGDIIGIHRIRMPPRVIKRAFTPVAPAAPPVELSPFAMAMHQASDGRENLETLNEAAFLTGMPLMLSGASAGSLPDTGHLWALGRTAPAQTQRWLAGADAFVSAATGDTDGEVVWRAAHAGCALVLADSPDYRELWDGAAVFAPPGDAVALAHSLRELMDADDTRGSLAMAAKKRASEWSIDRAGLAWTELLSDLANASTRTSAA